MGDQAILVGEVPIQNPPLTLMVRWGDWVGRACLLFLLAAASHADPVRDRRVAFRQVVRHVVLQQLLGSREIRLDRRQPAVEIRAGIAKHGGDAVRERIDVAMLVHAGVEQHHQVTREHFGRGLAHRTPADTLEPAREHERRAAATETGVGAKAGAQCLETNHAVRTTARPRWRSAPS